MSGFFEACVDSLGIGLFHCAVELQLALCRVIVAAVCDAKVFMIGNLC